MLLVRWKDVLLESFRTSNIFPFFQKRVGRVFNKKKQKNMINFITENSDGVTVFCTIWNFSGLQYLSVFNQKRIRRVFNKKI